MEAIRNIISDKCETCGIRPKAVVDGKARKGCTRCMELYHRPMTMNKSSTANTLIENLGFAYVDAEIDHIDAKYKDAMLNAKSDIYLYGPVGVGKTYAMAALFKHKVFSGNKCQRINFDEFCCRVRSTMNHNSKKTEYELVSELIGLDCLFIDDIGLRSKQETDFAYVTFYTILNKRQESSLPTYITTNKSIKQLASGFDSRIASRLNTATIIEMNGQDRRIK